ncbi:Uncharacterised protein [Mycobacterium tuberculosis]|nr:Uncharacterised protein [Mycobacterium tuberculosis]
MPGRFIGLLALGARFGIHPPESHFGYRFAPTVPGRRAAASHQEIPAVVVRMSKLRLGATSLFRGGVCPGGITGGRGAKCHSGGVVVTQFAQAPRPSEGHIGSHPRIGCRDLLSELQRELELAQTRRSGRGQRGHRVSHLVTDIGGPARRRNFGDLQKVGPGASFVEQRRHDELAVLGGAGVLRDDRVVQRCCRFIVAVGDD